MDPRLTEVVDPLSGQIIRQFVNTKLQDSINQALATLPPGTEGAVVAFADGGHAELGVVGHIGGSDKWTYVGTIHYDWRKHDLQGGAAVRFAWPSRNS